MIRSYVRNCKVCGINHWIEHIEPRGAIWSLDWWANNPSYTLVVRYTCPLTNEPTWFEWRPYTGKPRTHGNWL